MFADTSRTAKPIASCGRGPLYVDPQTEEVLGREATYIGLGDAVAQHADVATMAVSSVREEVQIGDRVLPTEERRVDSSFFPSAPDTDVNGQIISVFSGVTQVGQYDVVVVNRGDREGLAVGNVLAIYKRGSLARDRIANEVIRLPSERAGLMMIFRTFENCRMAWCLRPSVRWPSTTRSKTPDTSAHAPLIRSSPGLCAGAQSFWGRSPVPAARTTPNDWRE